MSSQTTAEAIKVAKKVHFTNTFLNQTLWATTDAPLGTALRLVARTLEATHAPRNWEGHWQNGCQRATFQHQNKCITKGVAHIMHISRAKLPPTTTATATTSTQAQSMAMGIRPLHLLLLLLPPPTLRASLSEPQSTFGSGSRFWHPGGQISM